MALFCNLPAIAWRSRLLWQSCRRMSGIPLSPGLRKGMKSKMFLSAYALLRRGALVLVTLRAATSTSPVFSKGLGNCSRYNVAIGSSTSILGPNIPASTKETFISHLASYNMWALQGERGRASRGDGSSLWGRRVSVMFFLSC